MNRADRRAAAARVKKAWADREAWETDFKAICEEERGLWFAEVYAPGDVDGLVTACLAGNAKAMAVSQVIDQVISAVKESARNWPRPCLCCAREIVSLDFAICITAPARDNPTRAIGSPICAQCFADAGLESRILAALRPAFPDIRRINLPIREAGHA